MAKNRKKLLILGAFLFLANFAQADIRIISSQRLNETEEQLNSRYLLICQGNSGFLEDTDTGDYFEISRRDLCEQIRVMGRLASNDCSLKLQTSERKIESTELECSIEQMLGK